ncbi:uncharacterized protein LOC108622030 isoform X2 [Ceratina calcarata]|uniref:Uncharacterized protein LOC108622030 isoform X2 n=1 Tax=Ceratina calcarata TaxID=156304 RepID=A0AAJ7RWE9_9HYME|nr:uncharacterized protein LOC108622030 isoform X2 [Ceratina calcarata]
MSECLGFTTSMTGSTNSGPLQPHNDSLPLSLRSAPFDLYPTSESPVLKGHRQGSSRKMTLTSANGQPIQLTPLWEHVVRTRKFPSEVDSRLTFLEISERLRDPEWEVRQHALRVLIDVLPTLNADTIDKIMQPVISELILRDGLNRSEVRDSFQTNVTTGVILSVPSLLFPSSNSPSPNPQLVKDATIALASRLAQVPHQEAVLKSLMKIRDAVGVEEFEKYLEEYDNKLKRNIEILSKIYNVKSSGKTHTRSSDTKGVERTSKKESDNKWESDSDTSGIVEEEDEVNNATMPAARVVLETEIKFNEETAITMTILEEKEDSEQEREEKESEGNVKDETDDPERRKTPRRVHFGGEIVKLRTPDSDDTESLETAPKTRIPLPVSPATKMPNTRPRPSSQPCSPNKKPGKFRRARSVSNSPKREIYTHNAELSPKKSILTRTGSPQLASKTDEQSKKKKTEKQEEKDNKEAMKDDKNVKIIKIDETIREARKEEIKLVQSGRSIDTFVSNVDDGSKSLENADLLKNEKQDIPRIGSAKANNYMVQIKTEEHKITESDPGKNAEERRKLFKGDRKLDAFFGSTVRNDDADQISAFVNENVHENEIVQKDPSKLSATGKLRNYNSDGCESLKNVDSERSFISDCDKRNTVEIEKNGSADGEMECMPTEPNWEELGLVDREVLEDLHNKVSLSLIYFNSL